MDHGMRAKELIAALVAAVACLVAAPRAGAEPYLMVRAGAKCLDCHVNKTGGGKRTAFAHIHSKDILHDLDLLPIPSGVKAFNGEISQYLSVGSDLRVRETLTWNERQSAEVRNDQVARHHLQSNDLSVIEALVYGQVDLWPDIVTLYVDENLNGGATNREAFGMIHGVLPWQGWIKAGRMFPTYGLRLYEDSSFVRSKTGFTFVGSDEGVEFGAAPGPLQLATSVTNGSSGDKEVQVTWNGYTLLEDVPVVRTVLVGASAARFSNRRHVEGAYAGTNWWKLTGLVEFDNITDNTPQDFSTTARKSQYAAYAELNCLLLDWLNLRGTFDFVKVAGDRDAVRYTVGAEPFVNKYLQPRILFRINNGPTSQPELNTNELWLEMHFFL